MNREQEYNDRNLCIGQTVFFPTYKRLFILYYERILTAK